MWAVGNEASGAGSSPTAVANSSLITEEKWVPRLLLYVSKSGGVTQEVMYLQEGQILQCKGAEHFAVWLVFH